MGLLAIMTRIAEQNPTDIVVESTDTASPVELVESWGRRGLVGAGTASKREVHWS